MKHEGCLIYLCHIQKQYYHICMGSPYDLISVISIRHHTQNKKKKHRLTNVYAKYHTIACGIICDKIYSCFFWYIQKIVKFHLYSSIHHVTDYCRLSALLLHLFDSRPFWLISNRSLF